MKKITLFFIFITQFLIAQNGFEIGNIAYKKGDYKTAIAAYESVFDKKKHSTDLYFNIANCYYKLNMVAPAIFYYEKALVINPNNMDAQNNLQIAQKLLIDDLKSDKKISYYKWFQKTTDSLHYNYFAWIAVNLGGLFSIFFCIYYFSNKPVIKRIFFSAFLIILLLMIVSISISILEKKHYYNDKPAIVFAEIAPVKKFPKKDSKDLIVLHQGSKVFVIKELKNYKKVELINGQIGWILSDNIREVKQN